MLTGTLASMTFHIHPYVIYGVGAVVGLIALFFIIRPIARKSKQRSLEARHTYHRIQREGLETLFPQPWIDIYDACLKLGSYTPRIIMLQAWLAEQEVLPRISMGAIEKLAGTMGSSEKICRLLSPYVAFSGESLNKPVVTVAEADKEDDPKAGGFLLDNPSPDYHSLKRLPTLWYQFAIELINYSGSFSLWRNKICWGNRDKRGKHPCCAVPLTSEQAKIFVDAVAEGVCEHEKMSCDIVDFIELESEKVQSPPNSKAYSSSLDGLTEADLLGDDRDRKYKSTEYRAMNRKGEIVT